MGEDEAAASADEPEESEDESEAFFAVSRTSSCPTNTYVTSAEQCAEAAEVLGFDSERTISRADRPRGCYKTSRDLVFFNRNNAGADPSGSRNSICVTSSEETPEEQDDGSSLIQSENGTCPPGTSYITTQEDCEAAGEV